MKAIINFIKTTVIGGVVVIIPMAIIILVIAHVLSKLITVTAPVTQGMEFGPLSNAIIVVLLAIFVIVLVFFLAGLLLSSSWGTYITTWLENNIFSHIPMFSTLQQLTQQVAGIENSNFPTVEVDMFGSGVKVIGVAVEKLADGRYMVYAPSSPVVTVGQLYVVPEERITVLDASIPVTLDCLSKIGLEANKIYS